MPDKRGKILVIRGGAIGDFILTLPAIAAVRRTFPETQLDLLGYPQVAELARLGGIIDSFRSIEARPLAGFFARNGKLDPALSDYFEGVNLVISYLYDPDHFFKTNVGRVSKAQFIQGLHRPSEDENLHATEVFLKPLERLAIYGADPVPRLSLGAQQMDHDTWLAVHPGSGSDKKNWALEKWRDLLQKVIDHTNWNILIVGGEADCRQLQLLQRTFSNRRLRFVNNVPLVETAKVLGACRLFIGHDSGITHLACALGLKALVLWGPTNESIWRPMSHKALVLKHSGGLEALSVEVVFNQLLEISRKCE